MRRRQPLPRIWLMTDERLPDLFAAIAALPPRSGIVFRHYSLALRQRRALFEQVARKARAARHMLLLAGPPALARQWGADGAHDRSLRVSLGIRAAAVHSSRERIAARRCRADLIFVSPVYATRSHQGARPLGRRGARQIAGADWTRTVLLGGMDAARFRKLGSRPPYGWAGIDAFGVRT